MGLGRRWQGKGDDARRSQKLVEREAAGTPMVNDLHGERLGAPCDLRSDPSHAHEAEYRPGEIVTGQLVPRWTGEALSRDDSHVLSISTSGRVFRMSAAVAQPRRAVVTARRMLS